MEKFHVYMDKFKDIRTSVRNIHVIIIFNKQGYFTDTGYYTHFSLVRDYAILPFNLYKYWKTYPKEFRTFQRKIAEINQTIHPEIWPNVDDDAPWECLPMSYAKQFQQNIKIHMKKFVTLELPSNLPRVWLSEGYTHIYFGAVRFALTARGRKGLPTIARLALLEIRYADYQHACIGTVETTLNAGTILVTMFPNFNTPIADPQLLYALKIQVQIVGVFPSRITYGATLHYQMVYRIQNHSFDFVTPQSTENALFLQMETDHPSCIYVPRQFPRNELLKMILDTWLTSHEQHHQSSKNVQPVQSVQSTTHHFRKKSNGQIEIMFKREPTQKESHVFPLIMPSQKLKPTFLFMLLIIRKPIYVQTDEGHMYWDVCFYRKCTKKSRSTSQSSQQKLQVAYEQNSSHIGLLGQPSRKFDYFVTYTPHPSTDEQIIPTEWTDDDDDH
ncbi:Uncharacterized protein Adt_18931 [Abeliophyllum distichum]|uniref:Uncharacterized protein n=1 Tax=Abeliophyllum distichum TaxID=126358 RepID=A0ABD1TKS5_9LAMI